MYNTVILLGTNTGDLSLNLNRAIRHIDERCGRVINNSSVYKTAPWGLSDQPYFLNQVIQVETALSPEDLLNQLLSIETEMGRERQVKWEPRLIDLDILFFEDKVIRKEGLVIPHPHLHERRFTLVPLAEILPGYMHPVLGKTVSELLSVVPDDLNVTMTEKAGHSINRI